MASDPTVGQHQSQDSPAVLTFTVRSNERTIDLLIPDEEGVRYVAKEIFQGQCYRPVPRNSLIDPRIASRSGMRLATTFLRSPSSSWMYSKNSPLP